MDQLRVEYKGDQGGAAFQWRDLAVCIALGASFGLMAFASIEFTRGNERVAAVWIPNALIVAFLLRSRLGHELPLFAAVFAGNIGANLLAGDAAATAAGLAASNLLEIWLAICWKRLEPASHEPNGMALKRKRRSPKAPPLLVLMLIARA